MKNRWLLNIVLIVFVGFGFYGITSAINMMATSQEQEDHEFSYIKRTADQHWYNSNYEESARYFKQLADSDDTNCIAHFLYAYSLTNLIESQLDKLEDNPKLTEQELNQNVHDAIDGYLEAIQFSQYRNISRIRLSVLYGFVGEAEKSKEFAMAAYEDGRSLSDLRNIYERYGCLEIHYQMMMEISQDTKPTTDLSKKQKTN